MRFPTFVQCSSDTLHCTLTLIFQQGRLAVPLLAIDKTFTVLMRTNFSAPNQYLAKISYIGIGTKDVAKGSVISLPVRGGGYGIDWTLTGSEKYGYYDSYAPPTAWMSSIMDIIGDRKLKHVAMPGSHDAGISKIDGTAGGEPHPEHDESEKLHADHYLGASEQNCQTQAVDIYEQLQRGSRYFDIRPVLGNGGKYLTGHYNTDGSKLGCNGESIDDVVSDINR